MDVDADVDEIAAVVSSGSQRPRDLLMVTLIIE
jgi:hypothetical protein